jgi:diadenosine tetraphosphatase ApaH/serine/threonine PP2A family protein phosphatase
MSSVARRSAGAILDEAIQNQTRTAASPADLWHLICLARDAFDNDPAVVTVTGDFSVVGDLHGDLHSLLRVFNSEGYPPSRRFVFLGDYVDRGSQSLEVMTLLLSLKVLFPNDIYLLRGNHECSLLTATNGFKDECSAKAGLDIYQAFLELFTHLPVAAVLNDQIFCVHGGFSLNLKSRSDLYELEKPGNDLTSGTIGEMLWSDFADYVEYTEESERGCGFVYGHAATADFLSNCGFLQIIRSHEFANGADWPFGPDGGCLTVFSACDYQGRVNDGGFARVSASGEVTAVTYPVLIGRNRRHFRVILPAWHVETPDEVLSRRSGRAMLPPLDIQLDQLVLA